MIEFDPPQTSKATRCRQAARRLAFTLVEMLVVMGIIVALLSMMVPVFKNLLGGRGVESSINTVTDLIQFSRTYAISHQACVYTLFKNVKNSDGNWELRCAAASATDGSGTWNVGEYQGLGRCRGITRLFKVPNVKNVKFSQMPSAVQNVAPPDLANDGSYIAGWYPSETSSGFPEMVIGGENFKGANFISFNRDGGLGTSVDPSVATNYGLLVETKFCLGLIGTRGDLLLTNSSDGAIVAAYGGSGMVRIVRP